MTEFCRSSCFADDAPRVFVSTRPTSVADLVALHGQARAETLYVLVDGVPLPREDWEWTFPGEGSLTEAVAIPQGGGGGGGSNPLSIVAMVAAVALAAMVPGGAAIGGWLAANSTLGIMTIATIAPVISAIGSAAVLMGGALLASALQPTPKAPDAGAVSQTYSFNAQNSARIGEAVKDVSGRHRVTLDYAALPYVEYSNNDQRSYLLFCVGVGIYDVESLRLGDTVVWESGEFIDGWGDTLELEVYQPGEPNTAFPDNVETSSEVGSIELLAVGAPDRPTDGWYGPYTANAAGLASQRYAVDIQAPAGVGYQASDGNLEDWTISWEIQARQIDDNGSPVGDWETLETASHTDTTRSAVRLTRYVETASAARHEVRVRLTSAWIDDAGGPVLWTGLRAYYRGTYVYPDVTNVAIIVKATGQVSGAAAQQFRAVVQRLLPPLDDVGGDLTPTSSIARYAVHMLRTMGVPDNRIDLAEFARLDAVWAERGDECNLVFDTETDFWSALRMVLACGRAFPLDLAGFYTVVRDEPRAIRAAHLTPLSLTEASFELQPWGPDEPDGVRMTYMDAETWTQSTVDCVLPGQAGARFSEVEIRGITSREQAWPEGITLAARALYRRRYVRVGTEMEGLPLAPGDLVSLAHDVPSWGQYGLVDAWNPATRALQVGTHEGGPAPLEWTDGAQHYVAIRDPYGVPTQAIACSRGASDYELILDTDPGVEIISGLGLEDPTQIMFGPASELWVDLLVLAMTPGEVVDGAPTATVYGVVEDARVHEAELGSPPAVAPVPGLPTVPARPVVASVAIRQEGTTTAPILVVSWTPAAGARAYRVELSRDGGTTWSVVASEVLSTELSVPVEPSAVVVGVSALGTGVGPRVTASTTAGSVSSAPASVTGLALLDDYTDGDAVAQWQPSARATYYVVEVLEASVVRYETAVTVNRFDWLQALSSRFGGPWRTFSVRITAANAVGEAAPVTLDVSDPAPTGVTSLTGDPTTSSITVTWTDDPEATRYNIAWWEWDGEGAFVAVGSASGVSSGCVISGLAGGTQHMITVTAYDDFPGSSGAASTIYVTTE